MNTPAVSFIYAFPLDQDRRICYQKNDLGHYPTTEEVKRKLSAWSELWQKTEEKHQIIKILIELTGRTPKRSLECFIYGTGFSAMSAPFMIPTLNKRGEEISDEMFIQTVIHELLHIFVTTDTQNYWEVIKEKYNNEDVVFRNHIIVYAFLFDIYERVFGNALPDLSRTDLQPNYQRVVALVQERSSTQIIKEYKELT